ncbi:neuropeptide CCHamide-1 receptor-like [Acanthaster planci]|uniref:Neuropeptide CCHamide-1 receptor-like n=1 Tax=Acanthaster planci TaxID=133434 RepID=A0A8B7XY56_ACAPL|nr:neuropeptide CCHamide-1 receptor-like [Acanthaster planci]XP_022084712.1 neuropeptide CCHamide-1 receptor-like [Acanthaster planci]XP_022084713.1 neuropeptide CCHamide-1 receptor-like [Acanthaster planci]XP_022084714.1 neuropeptide CCHamide-1 receptor-like [Acanthaster planci]
MTAEEYYSSYSYYGNLSHFFMGDDSVDWVAIDIFILAAVLGLLGNASIIVVILLNRELRRSQINALIIQLAIGDFLFLLSTVPIKIEHEIYPFWQFGTAACKAYRFGETLAIGVCVYSITAFSVGRFLGIVMKKGERNFTKVLIITEWLLAITVAAPIIFLVTLVDTPTRSHAYCQFYYETTAARVYGVFWFSFLYVVPLGLIAYTNILVIIKLLQSTRKFSGEQVNRSLLKQFRIRRNRAAMFILITVFFAVFWMPYYAFRFWQFVGKDSAVGNQPLRVLGKLHYYAAIANSCCNPFVMYMMSSKYRMALCCRLPAHRMGVASGNSIRGSRAKTTRFSLSVRSKQPE